MSYIYDISSLRVNQLLYCVSLKIYNKFANYTDIQPKISIDEISLLWLFCGC